MTETTIAPKDDFNYYDGTIYWNNFDLINAHINRTISGDESVGWATHFVRTYGPKDKTLVLNCGNGWVERDLFRLGVVSHVVGTDINQKLLDQASAEARRIGMSAAYRVADANQFDGAGQTYDLVVNYAAMHHIARLNRMAEVVAEMTRGRGIFLNYDYVGPHRNQYDETTWLRCLEVRSRLPKKYQTSLGYPHVPTMIASDPSEAVHSELLLETLLRHFDVLESAKFGGGVAYILLFQNVALYRDQHTEEGGAILNMIMEEDRKLLAEHASSNLFEFCVARAKNPPPSPALRTRWQDEEDEREARARADGGRYYPPTPLEKILYPS